MKGLRKVPLAVIGGGWSRERAVSLRSCQAVTQAFSQSGWDVTAIDLLAAPLLKSAVRSASPAWAVGMTTEKLVSWLLRKGIKTVFPVLHGPFGEDGRFQGLMEMNGIRCAGSGFSVSALAMDKHQCKAVLQHAGIPTPKGLLLRKGEKTPAWKKKCITKPCSDGSSFGVTLCKNAAQYRKGIKAALQGEGRMLIEEYIAGREFAVGVVGKMALPAVEIIPGNEFYDFDSKYGKAGYQHLVPAPVTAVQEKTMRVLALKTHQLLGCRGFSRVDMILGKQGLKVIEINTLPGMTKDSLFPDAARAAGWDMSHLVERMLFHSLEEY